MQEYSAMFPNIQGSITRGYASSQQENGALSTGVGISGGLELSGENARVLSFNASKSNSLFGKSSTIQPSSYQILTIIKI